jgi:hypothetical protein
MSTGPTRRGRRSNTATAAIPTSDVTNDRRAIVIISSNVAATSPVPRSGLGTR